MCGEAFMHVGGAGVLPICAAEEEHVGKHPLPLLLQEADGDFHQKVTEGVL